MSKGVDRRGNLCWDGKPVEVRGILHSRLGRRSGRESSAVSAVVGAVGAASRVGVRRRMAVGGHMRTLLAQALP
jgi:hypothetical protein